MSCFIQISLIFALITPFLQCMEEGAPLTSSEAGQPPETAAGTKGQKIRKALTRTASFGSLEEDDVTTLGDTMKEIIAARTAEQAIAEKIAEAEEAEARKVRQAEQAAARKIAEAKQAAARALEIMAFYRKSLEHFKTGQLITDGEANKLHSLIEGIPIPLSTSQKIDVLNALPDPKKYINSQNITGDTPLHLATSPSLLCRNSLLLIQHMIGLGADVNKQNNSGVTPLYRVISYASEPIPHFPSIKPRPIKDSEGEIDSQEAVKRDGQRIELSDGLKQAAHSIAATLLRFGADPNISTKDGQTCLHTAILNGSRGCTDLLLKYPATRRDITTKLHKATPLELAERLGKACGLSEHARKRDFLLITMRLKQR